MRDELSGLTSGYNHESRTFPSLSPGHQLEKGRVLSLNDCSNLLQHRVDAD